MTSTHPSMTDSPTNLPIRRDLIDETQALAKELNMSWSRLITLALSEFLRRYRERKELLEQVNVAYSDGLDEEETQLLQAMRSTHRRVVETEW
ncbi:hypothetical protein [Coleofasciculus sp. C1-SOL-03]|uniref:hypothetical protein n=1 Tax=Coleofasciculus sp. C1-SOL-03 TaxID=3069522 RepID=UPI004063F230